MSTMTLELKEGVHVLTLTNHEGENSLTIDVLKEYHAALDEVEAFEGNTALMVTCEHEKTFSTGINLGWLGQQSPEGIENFVSTLEKLYYRIALLEVPTVFAINGNCYAGGAIMASCADFRFMRADRGRFCYPEVNIHIPFTHMMTDVIDLIPNKHALKYMALLGTAYTGEECKANNIVDDIFPMDQLQEQSFAFAKQLAEKDRKTYGVIKRRLREKLAKRELVPGYIA
ncbi:enoyl-CoA hydratase-related protein [Maricurvus nonylphenolicus]|uniref:enoyl-CoA hydratase/isomerase family protein n=1 Tax=Maricurvus nonylphenolicus TaxID=1008307 RepID=UPI0036F32EF7